VPFAAAVIFIHLLEEQELEKEEMKAELRLSILLSSCSAVNSPKHRSKDEEIGEECCVGWE
jgi:inorganic pyrophosphatase/exopolyphosphatase